MKINVLTSSIKIDQMLEHLDSKPKFIAMDFEFDNIGSKHVLSLGQLMIDKSIYVYDLRRFNKIQKAKYIESMMYPSIKLLHGSESLDLKAMLEFMTRPKFDKFLDTVVDTRFLCEVYHILNKTSYHKCTIYTALHDMKAIDDKEYAILKSVHIDYKLKWNIDNLDEKRLMYAAKDVMFLHNLYIEYKMALGDDVIKVVMDVFRQVFITRLDGYKIMGELDDVILDRILAKSDLGDLTVRDLLKVDYFRKPLKWIFFKYV